jgi:hypothetical protein
LDFDAGIGKLLPQLRLLLVHLMADRAADYGTHRGTDQRPFGPVSFPCDDVPENRTGNGAGGCSFRGIRSFPGIGVGRDATGKQRCRREHGCSSTRGTGGQKSGHRCTSFGPFSHG